MDVILKSFFCTLNGGYHLVAPSVKLGVEHLTFLVTHYIVNNYARTIVKRCCGAESGDGAFEFAVVENYGASLVAEEVAGKVVSLGATDTKKSDETCSGLSDTPRCDATVS